MVDIFDLLKFLIPFLIAWNVWIHKMVINQDKAMAVNDTRDTELIKRIARIDEKLGELQKALNNIEIKLAKRE